MKKFNHKQLQSLLLRIKKKHKFKCIQLIDKKITNRHLVLKVKINGMFYAIKFLLNSKDVNYFHFRFNLKNYLLLKDIFKNLICKTSIRRTSLKLRFYLLIVSLQEQRALLTGGPN